VCQYEVHLLISCLKACKEPFLCLPTSGVTHIIDSMYLVQNAMFHHLVCLKDSQPTIIHANAQVTLAKLRNIHLAAIQVPLAMCVRHFGMPSHD